jgi:hypothetical protein
MNDDPKWYDSVWLAAYYAAKEVVAAAAPEKYEGFLAAFDILRTRPNFAAVHLHREIDPELLTRIRQISAAIPRDKYEMHELKSFGRFVVHDWPEFSALQHELTRRVSDLAGEELEPNYNFLSLYTRMGACEPHLDSPMAKWTLDICIDQSEPWPIHFSQIVPWPEQRPRLPDDWREAICENDGLRFSSAAMEPGDAILFSGSSQWHYRDLMPAGGARRHCDLLFLHYIPSGAKEIVVPANWSRIFAIPELAAIPGILEAS